MEQTKPTFRYNNYGVKSSSDQYRNIKGVHYVCYTSNPDAFEEVRKESKEKGLKVRIINGEMYVEKQKE